LSATEHHFAAAALTSAGKGMVVFSACSHAGIINVMTDVVAQSGQSPYAVFGGESSAAAVLVVPETHFIYLSVDAIDIYCRF
jgi:metal-dependent hydrolase (beta-lactamase superfamily II)